MESNENLPAAQAARRRGSGRLAWLAWRMAVGIGAAVVATGVLLPIKAPAARADVVFNQNITRSEVIARAQFWYNKDLTYSQNAVADDPEGTSYRTDCPGYVSMTWHLSPTGKSAPTTEQLPSSTYTTELSGSPSSSTDLQAGDILDAPGEHTVLFSKWDGSAHAGFWACSFGSTPVAYQHLTFSMSKWDSHPVSDCNAYRYKHIIDDSAGTAVSGQACTAGSCTSAASYPVAGASGVAIEEKTCAERVNQGGHAILYVSQDISWTGGGSAKLDGYTLHVQAQRSNVTQEERHCSGIDSLIDAHSSGSESCYFDIIDPASGSWNADGWLHAQAHNGNWLG